MAWANVAGILEFSPHICTGCGHDRSLHKRATLPYEHYTYCVVGQNGYVRCPCTKFTMQEQAPKDEPEPYVDRFDDILKEMSDLHTKKGKDYGGSNDPYANVRASQEFGVDGWKGALIRLNDKITRLKAFIRNGDLANESALDSISDIAVYAVIMRILYDEQYAKQEAKPSSTLAWCESTPIEKF